MRASKSGSFASVGHSSNIVYDSQTEHEDINIGLEFKDLRLKLSKDVELLKGVSGCFLPGEVVAIMGPSGCSKTTLLNLLSGRMGYHYVTGIKQWEGEIKVNNFDFEPPSWGGRLGFVEQFDCTYERLTVREAVKFAADLQLQGDNVLKGHLIDEVLSELDIFNCQNVYCGGSGNVKGISGGQLKRTMIARSLITNPRFLFLDEPTSGLDSFSSLELLKTLNKIAKDKNKTIVATLHQPSKAMIKYIDRVIFMYKGKFLFQGTPEELTKFMKEDLHELEDENANVLEEFFATIEIEKKLNSGDFSDWKSMHDPYEYSSENMPIDQIPTYVSVPATTFAQIWYLFVRHVKVNLRNHWTLLFNILVSSIIRPIFASLFFINARNKDPTWAFYGVLWITVDMLPKVIFPYVLQLLEDKTMFMKEYTLQMYDIFPFFMARFLWQMIYCFVNCLIVLPIYYGVMGLQGNFGMMLLIFWIYTIMMSNAVFAVACLFQDIKIMNTIFDTFIQGGLCICVFVPTKRLQLPILKMGFYFLGIMKWGVNAVLTNEFIKFGKVDWTSNGEQTMREILEDFEVINGIDFVFGKNPNYAHVGIYYMLFYTLLSATIALIILRLTGKVML